MGEFRNKILLYERERHVFYLTPLSVANLIAERHAEHLIVLPGGMALDSEGNILKRQFFHHEVFKDRLMQPNTTAQLEL
jgi:hypothetical protein